jgi:hypothetical protein
MHIDAGAMHALSRDRAASRESASLTLASNCGQVCRKPLRNIHMPGYHGCALPSRRQRQSQLPGMNVHTGSPIAPARYAGDESIDMTTSHEKAQAITDRLAVTGNVLHLYALR